MTPEQIKQILDEVCPNIPDHRNIPFVYEQCMKAAYSLGASNKEKECEEEINSWKKRANELEKACRIMKMTIDTLKYGDA